MQLKSSIPKLKYLVILLAVSMLFISTLQVKASNDRATTIVNNAINAVVNSTSGNVTGTTDTIQNGVSYKRTGYLCYLLSSDGDVLMGHSAVALQSPNYADIPGSVWICQSRKGHTVGSWSGVAPWNLSPWQSGGGPTNEPAIKNWFRTKDSNDIPNAKKFVSDIWGNTAATKFSNDEYVLVIETIMGLQFSRPSGSGSESVTITLEQRQQILEQCIIEARTMVYQMSINEVYSELEAEGVDTTLLLTNSDGAREQLAYEYSLYAIQIAGAIIDERNASSGSTSGSRIYYGDPVIGTPSNLISYDVWDTTVFDSYLNKVAPHAEQIATSEAGFTAYSGLTDTLSNDQVHNYGVAMMIIHCNDPVAAQSTWDNISDTPAPPPDESDGQYTIIKYYRDINTTTSVITDKGKYSLSNLTNEILIEDEPIYKVKEWFISSSPHSSMTSITWQVHSTPSGTDTGLQELPSNKKYLHVLLEQGNGTDTTSISTNYNLSQSTIARYSVQNK